MPWIQIKINATAANAEELGDVLMDVGAVSVTFQDTHDTPVFEPLPGETRLWGDTDVIGLFDAETDMKVTVHELEGSPLLGPGFHHKIEQIEDKDWEREWMDNFHPMRFGQRLWICPSWRDIPDPQAVNVLLDPGLAFGTGTHPTTALCLQWLDSLDLEGKTIIDFGCGSGILAIAAAKLGAGEVTGVDIDEKAVETAADNAANNGVSLHLQVSAKPLDGTFQRVVANILTNPLKMLAPLLAARVAPGGKLALSGVLEAQAAEVIAAYAPYIALRVGATHEGWVRLEGEHPAPAVP